MAHCGPKVYKIDFNEMMITYFMAWSNWVAVCLFTWGNLLENGLILQKMIEVIKGLC